MITVIRKQLKTKFLQIFVWVFMIIFGIFLILPNMFDREHAPTWVVQVNDEKIYVPTFMRAVSKQESNIQAIRQQYGAYADMFIQMLGLGQDPKVLAFDQIVRDEVLNKVADSIPLHIHENYVERAVSDPIFGQHVGILDVLPIGIFEQGRISQQALRFYLSQNKLHMKQFESLIEQALARNIVLELAGLAAYVPSYMKDNRVNSELAKRKYAILTFSFDKIKEQEKVRDISTEELVSFFEKKNKASKQYWVPEMRSANVWEINPQHYGIVISDDAIHDYYEKNRLKKYVSEPAKVQVRHILLKKSDTEPKEMVAQRAMLLQEELTHNPKLFEEKAREYSNDSESAKLGGLLPFFSKGEKDPVFERKSFSLKQTGDIAPVFETSEGYEIVQLVEKKATAFKPLQEVENEIHAILLQQLFTQQLHNDMKRFLDTKHIDDHALNQFMKDKKGTLVKQDLASKDGSRRMQLLFKLKEGAVDFYIEGNVGYVVQTTSIQKEYMPNFDTVKDTVKNDLIQEQSKLVLERRVQDALEAIKKQPAHDVAQQFGATIIETDFMSHDNEEDLKKLEKDKIPTREMFQVENKGGAMAQVLHDGYVFYVLDVLYPSTEEYNQKKHDILKRTNTEIKGFFVQGFVASLSRNVKIEVNESLLTQIEKQAL